MTLHELITQLRNEEETVLLEVLGLKSDDLVDAFYDVIQERYNYLVDLYDENL